MLLAGCIATAYNDSPEAMLDAQHASSALVEWTEYDAEGATGVDEKLIDRYLARTYHSKADSSARLDLLKCFDMYHGSEQDVQVQQYVERPDASFASDAVEEES